MAVIIVVGGATMILDEEMLVGGAYIVLGIIYIIISLGFLKGWKLWWYLGVIFTVIEIILELFSLPGGIVVIIIDVIILWYLFRPNVKAYFLD